jgi:hypothetical protein
LRISIEPTITVYLAELRVDRAHVVLDAGIVMAASAFGSILMAALAGLLPSVAKVVRWTWSTPSRRHSIWCSAATRCNCYTAGWRHLAQSWNAGERYRGPATTLSSWSRRGGRWVASFLAHNANR